MIKDITFGQFLPANSFIHRLDARFKIFLTVLFIVFIFMCSNFYSLALAAGFIIACILLSKIKIKHYLKSLKPIIPIIIFTAILNTLYTSGGKIYFEFWVFSVSSEGLKRSVFMCLRVVLLILCSSVMTYSTTPNDLSDALESIFSPLKIIGLGNAVHTLSMMMTIALRFIPTLLEETDKIMSAQKARGADFESGSIISRLKALIPILIPLLISSLRRATELAEAMECRCYNGGEGRQRMRAFKAGLNDYLSLAFTGLICTVIILLNTL